MPHLMARNEDGSLAYHIAIPDTYCFGGFLFDIHSYYGPIKLRKDRSQAERAGRKFFKVIDRFKRLRKEQQERYRV